MRGLGEPGVDARRVEGDGGEHGLDAGVVASGGADQVEHAVEAGVTQAGRGPDGAELAGIAMCAGKQPAARDDAAAEAVGEVEIGEVGTGAPDAEEALGDRRRRGSVLHRHGHPEGILEDRCDLDQAPLVERRRRVQAPSLADEEARDADPLADHAAALDAMLGDEFAVEGRQPVQHRCPAHGPHRGPAAAHDGAGKVHEAEGHEVTQQARPEAEGEARGEAHVDAGVARPFRGAARQLHQPVALEPLDQARHGGLG